ATMLDSLVRECDIKRIDFIKVDIDGYECGMLRGGQETLRAWHPVIVLELSPHQLDDHGGSIEELVDLLAAAGYSLEDLASRAPLPMSGAGLRALIPHGASRNAIAMPGKAKLHASRMI